jgi:hypothetical protein
LLDEKPPPNEKIGAVALWPKIEKLKINRIAKTPTIITTLPFAF